MKRKTRKNKNIYFLSIIILILIFSSVGVGYAYWSDTISADVKVSAGDVNVEFSGQGSFSSEDKIAIMNTLKVNSTTEKLSSTGIMHLNYPVILKLKIKNVGTIPIKLKEGFKEDINSYLTIQLVHSKIVGSNIIKEYIPINNNESKLQFSYVKLDTEVIQPDKEGTIELMITGLEDKHYYFDLKTPFEQFNSSREANSAWSKMLDLSGEVQVFK